MIYDRVEAIVHIKFVVPVGTANMAKLMKLSDTIHNWNSRVYKIKKKVREELFLIGEGYRTPAFMMGFMTFITHSILHPLGRLVRRLVRYINHSVGYVSYWVYTGQFGHIDDHVAPVDKNSDYPYIERIDAFIYLYSRGLAEIEKQARLCGRPLTDWEKYGIHQEAILERHRAFKNNELTHSESIEHMVHMKHFKMRKINK